MINTLKIIDQNIKKILNIFCSILLLAMVTFTVYTIVMRYIFKNPPMWGDLLTVLSNIWLVFFALALTVRDKDHIALNLIYNWLPLKLAFLIQQFWTAVIFCLGIVMIVWGVEAVATMGGKYWEMWHFAWEDNQIVFKPNYMPKKYAVAIVPISGLLVCCAALISIIEDSIRFMTGTYRLQKNAETG